MKVIEFEAKELLKSRGAPVPEGGIAHSGLEAFNIAKRLGGEVVVKAQIPAHRRYIHGGILFASSPIEARLVANDLIGQELMGYEVDTVLIETRVKAVSELFIAVTFDPVIKQALILGSLQGGTDVEARETIISRAFSSTYPLPLFIGREVASRLGMEGLQLLTLAEVIHNLANTFMCFDALLLEANPLLLDQQGNWWLADVHLELDDDAAFRQHNLYKSLPFSVSYTQRSSDFERLALEIDQADYRGVAGRLVPFDGDLGLLIGGGGASLTIFDAVLNAGLKPANYCEIGGNPSVRKTAELTKLILSQPKIKRLAVIMNIVNNTRVDLMARGVIKGVLELGLEPKEAIVVFRVPGSWEEEGRSILDNFGVPFLGRETNFDQVVEFIRSRF